MMTVNDLTNMMWYIQHIIIVDQVSNVYNLGKVKENALFVGDNAELRSDLYKDLKNRYVQSFGSIDDYIVITLKK